MHAGVGSSGGDNRHALSDNARHGFFQNLLNGNPVLLSLPAAVGRAVIFEYYFEVAHFTNQTCQFF